MGKRVVSKRAVMSFAAAKKPAALSPETDPKMSFKEVKKRSILAGLRVLKAPAVIALLVSCIFATDGLKWGPSHEIDNLELFAGDCSVTRGKFQEGRTRSVALDVTHDPSSMDLLSPLGFVTACYHATCIRPGGGLLAAPVCSSFVYMNTGTSKRSANRPLGEDKFPSVDMGNKLCARTLCIIWIAASLRVWWLLEQPQGSWMEAHPCFQMVLRNLQVHRHRFTMGSYGARSEKPTWLYSSDAAIAELSDFRPPSSSRVDQVSLVDRYIDGSGQVRIKGNRHLKQSQSYPLAFGKAMARLRSRHLRANRVQASRFIKGNVRSFKNLKRNSRNDAMWVRCANLGPIFEYLA